MGAQAVETIDHLTEVGIKLAEATLQSEPALKDLDASKLTITRTDAPRKVPEPGSAEVWNMKTCTDHSMFPSLTNLPQDFVPPMAR